MISQTIKKRIIDETNIVEVVGEVVSLQKKGNSYFGLCPFHSDNHPSMSVNTEKKMFNCFSCGTKGNVIYFFARFHNITEQQASIELAKRIGITIDEQQTAEDVRLERFYKTMEEACRFYQFYLLNSEEGKKALAYLENRGIGRALIEKLKLGLAPSERDYLHQALTQKHISDLDQMELGLVRNADNDKVYDIFRNRIMFPIENHQGRIVAFSGRIYQQSDQAKYMNSMETAIFHKSDILYNFYNASGPIRRHDQVYLFEGFMDVIAAEKAGIDYGIATMGTALTKEHVQAILGLTKKITLCFDGDIAGIQATKRSAAMLSMLGMIPHAVLLPDNLDPDEYLVKYGAKALANYLTMKSQNVYDYLYDFAKAKVIEEDIESIEAFKKEVFSFLQTVKEDTIIQHFFKKMANDLQLEIATIGEDYQKLTHYVRHSENHVLGIENADKLRKKKIPTKVLRAYGIVINHCIRSKNALVKYIMGGYHQYANADLMTQFTVLEIMNQYYSVNDSITEEQFLEMMKKQLPAIQQYIEMILHQVIFEAHNEMQLDECLVTIKKFHLSEEQNVLFESAKQAIVQDNMKPSDEFIEMKKKTLKNMKRED